MDCSLKFQEKNEECNELMKKHFESNSSITENTLFGVFSIQVPEIECTKTHQHIIFTIDNSGSMSDDCKDGRTKMQHIKLTLENMIRFFIKESKERGASISIEVFAFSDSSVQVIKPINVGSNEIENTISKISGIYPEASTNMEDALKTSKKSITDYHSANPTHEISHVFMTDGDANGGITEPVLLKNIVNETASISKSFFLGFGIEHDATMLQTLGGAEKSEYQMIDSIEHAGLVYGEIIHSFLYKFAENVSLDCENGLFYDWKSNQWANSITIDTLVAGAKRDFHIISLEPSNVSIKLHKDENVFLTYSVIGSVPTIGNELMKFLWRQWTMEWLWKIIHRFDNIYNPVQSEVDLNESTMDFDFSDNHLNDSNNNSSVKHEINKKLKKGLKEFFKSMLSYMEKNNLKEDPFMKNLCDDIYISLSTMNTSLEHMYSANRQRSQGAQYNYTCNSYNHNVNHNTNNNISYSQVDYYDFDNYDNSTVNIFCSPRKSSRTSQASTVVNRFNTRNFNNYSSNNYYYSNNNNPNVTPSMFSDNICDDDDESNDQLFSSYNISQNITSPYMNRSAIRVMQDVSQIEDLDT